MARNLLENIFESKNTLNDSYPRYRGVKTFDLQRKHLLYGRIDKQGDAIYLDDSNLKQIVGSGGETIFILLLSTLTYQLTEERTK